MLQMNHLGGGLVIKDWDQEIFFFVVSGLSPVVTHMMAIGGLHGR